MPLFRLLAAPRSTRSVKIHAIPITTIFQRNCCYILVRSVHTKRQVAATYMSRRHVAATVNRSVCMQQMLPQQVAQIQSDLIFCDLLQRQKRQRFSQKFSSTHEAICRCDVSPHLVAATSRPTCTHGVICRRDVLLQLVA